MKATIKSGSLFKRKLSFLPTFLPDETLYSWCCRYHRLSGNGLAADTSLQLFGSETAGLMHDFPASLATFVARTDGEYGDARTLAYLHTLLGFYATFSSAELAEDLVRDMAEGSVGRLKFRLGLPSSRLGAGHPLKACPVCMREDEATRKMSYWRLAHQLPGIWLCHTHAEPLLESSIKTRTTHRLQWILPSDIKANQWHSPTEFSPGARLLLERLGCLIDGLREIRGSHLNQQALYHTYLAGLKRNGWLTRSGFVRMAAVREEFITYARGFDGILDYQFVDSAHKDDGGFLGLLLRRPRQRVHPTKHLVVISFLFENWPEFLQAYQSNTISSGLFKNANPQAKHDSRAHFKKAFLDLLSSEDISISRAARRCGISTGTATTWAQQNNIQFKKRPKVMHPDLERKISELLIKGFNRDDVAQENGVSRQAVDRLLHSQPALKEEWCTKSYLRKREEYRARFLQTVLDHPGLSIKAIRSIPGNGFQWLYRYDSEWLSTHLPSLWSKT